MRQASTIRSRHKAYWAAHNAYVLFRHHRWDTEKQVCVSVDGDPTHGVLLPTSVLKLQDGRWSDRIVLVSVPRWLMHAREIAWKRFDLPAVRSYHNKNFDTLTHDEKIQRWDDDRWKELKERADGLNGARRDYSPTAFDRKFGWLNA